VAALGEVAVATVAMERVPSEEEVRVGGALVAAVRAAAVMDVVALAEAGMASASCAAEAMGGVVEVMEARKVEAGTREVLWEAAATVAAVMVGRAGTHDQPTCGIGWLARH
jgi:hypothetical protein